MDIMKEAFSKLAKNTGDKKLEQQIRQAKYQDTKKSYRKQYKQPAQAEWSLSAIQLEALSYLALLSAFDRPLAYIVLSSLPEAKKGEEKQMFDLLLAHTAITPLDDAYFSVTDILREKIIPERNKACQVMEILTTYLHDCNVLENPEASLPLLLAYQSLSLISDQNDHAMQTYLTLFEEDNDAFAHEGIHSQISGFVHMINQDQSASFSPIQAKALYIHANEMLRQTPHRDTQLTQKYVTMLENISFTGTGERFEADAAKESGIAYRKRLNNLPKAREMHIQALTLSESNNYPVIAAFSHLELGKLEKEPDVKKKHFERSLELEIERKNYSGQAMAHLELGDLEKVYDQQKAIVHYQTSLKIERECGNQKYIDILEKKLLQLSKK